MANTPARVCPLAKKCGGCQLQNLSYDEQLHLKQATAIRLVRAGELPPSARLEVRVTMLPTLDHDGGVYGKLLGCFIRALSVFCGSNLI